MLRQNASDEVDNEEIEQYVKEQIRGARLSQIYKALINNDESFFSMYLSKIKECCQIIVLRCNDNDSAFLTSDNPVFFTSKVNYNAIYFPLTPKYLLLIGEGQTKSFDKINIKTVTNKGVKSFNKIILSKANTGVISNKNNLRYIL